MLAEVKLLSRCSVVLIASVLANSKIMSVFMDHLCYVQITEKGLACELTEGRSGVVFRISLVTLKLRNTFLALWRLCVQRPERFGL